MPNERERGLKLVDQTEAKLSNAYDKLARSVALTLSGVSQDIEEAIGNYRGEARAALSSGLWDAWLVRHPDGGDGEDFAGFVQRDLQEQTGHLDNFLIELATLLLLAPLAAQKRELLNSHKEQALMYSGAVWSAYVEAKTYGAPLDSLWVWSGPDDAHSCRICSEEVRQPPRPLSQMTIRPGRDTECLVRCRHSLDRVDVKKGFDKQVKIFGWR